MLMMSISTDEGLRRAMLWIFGDLSMSEWQRVPYGFVFVLAGLALAAMRAKALNALILGDEFAHSLGFAPQRERFILFVSVGLMTAASVSLGGMIGFIGLLMPHIMRFFIGSDSRMLIPASALGRRRASLHRGPDQQVSSAAHGTPGGRGHGHHRRAVFSVSAQEKRCPQRLNRRSSNLSASAITYEKSRPFIHDLSFTVGEGDFIGLLGANGSGKSTIMKLASGLLKPASGEISLWGKEPYCDLNTRTAPN